jgi:hypothetical protein
MVDDLNEVPLIDGLAAVGAGIYPSSVAGGVPATSSPMIGPGLTLMPAPWRVSCDQPGFKPLRVPGGVS